MPGIVLNPIANFGSGTAQPPQPYVPTYTGIYFAGEDQYYYSGSNLFSDPDRRGGINRTLFVNNGGSDSWAQTVNGTGAVSSPIRTNAGASLREYTLQNWYIESGSGGLRAQYKRLQTTNKEASPIGTPSIVYSDNFDDTSGDILGMETSLDEEYAILYGTEFLRTSNTVTHQSGLAKLPYSTITTSYAGDSTFKTNAGSGPDGQTIGGQAGVVNKVHVNIDKKIGVCHNGRGWNTVSGSVQEFVVLNNDGTQDTNFTFSGSWTNEFNDENATGTTEAVYYFDNPTDGKKRWIVAGKFKKFNGTTYNHILAFDETGSIDTTFNSGGAGFNSNVSNIFKVDDDYMCVVGQFTTYNGTNAQRAVVIKYDGTIATGMGVTDGNEIYSGVYHDNYLYLRGDFKNYTPIGGSSTFVNGIVSIQTDFATPNPNYDIGSGSFVTDFGYSDIADTGSSQTVEVFLG